MSIEKIYTVSNIKDHKDDNKIFVSLLFIAVIAVIGLGVWFIYTKKQSDKSSSTAKFTLDSTRAKLPEEPGPKQVGNPQNNIIENKKPTFFQDPLNSKVQDKAIEDNGAGTTNIVVGRVIKQQPNQTEVGESGVTVSYFFNNKKKETVTDANGYYEIVLPVSAENGIDCKIVLYYNKGSLLNTQQNISCNQKNITDIKF